MKNKEEYQRNQLRINVRNLDLHRESVPTFWISIFKELKNLFLGNITQTV